MMSSQERKIRVDQTKRVFNAIAKLLRKGSGSYRYLIYDMLGFNPGDYINLLDGLYITNAIVDYEQLKEDYEKLKRDYKMAELTIEKLTKQPYNYGIRVHTYFTPDDLKKGFMCDDEHNI